MANRSRYEKNQSWQAPSFLDSPTERMGWVEEACIQEAENWVKGQTAYNDIPKALDIISGRIAESANQKRSDLNINHAKFAVRKIVGTLADVREVGQFRAPVTYLKEQAAMFNKAVRAVAGEGEFPSRLRMCLQYMAATAKGYIWPKFERLPGEEGKINFEPLGLLDVLPVQVPSDNDLQKAYSVTIILFVPVYMAHGKFPAFQESLKPIARRRYTSTVSSRRLDLAERFKYGESAGEGWANLYCEIRYTFIRDLSINPFPDKEIPMGDFNAAGDPQTSWSYKVPYIGQEIPWTVRNGQIVTKPAEPEDCMIYPYRRLMITSRGMKQPLYDGPAKDLHGMLPLGEYCADDWPWEPCGFSLIHDIHSTERARQRAERGIDQVVKARLDPAMGYDRNQGLNDQTALTLDPFEERTRVGVDGEVRKVLDSLLPQWLLEIPAAVPEWVKYLTGSEDAQLGLNEIQNLAEFKATLQSENALEKALSFVGPIVKDVGFNMERGTARIWELLKYMVPQYYTTKRIMQWTGPDGISPETFDYDPEKIYPSHSFEEFQNQPAELVMAYKSKFTDAYRLRQYCRSLVLLKVPGSLLEITQTQEMLKYLMLLRSGFPIAPHDVAKKLNIENYGEIEGATFFDRYVNYKKKELELQAEIAMLAQSLAPGLAPPPGTTGPRGGQTVTGGRAPSGQQAPKLKQKTGGPLGPRVVASESG